MSPASFYDHTAAWNRFPFIYGVALEFSLIPQQKLIPVKELIWEGTTLSSPA